MKAISPESVQSMVARLKALNDTVDLATSEWNRMSAEAVQSSKQQLQAKIAQELNDCSKLIESAINPVVSSAVAQLAKFTALMSVPTDPFALPGYLLNVATSMYAEPASKIATLLASYAGPIAQLQAELVRASSHTIPSVPGLGTVAVKDVVTGKVALPSLSDVQSNIQGTVEEGITQAGASIDLGNILKQSN